MYVYPAELIVIDMGLNKPYCAVGLTDGTVDRAAPVVGYMEGWTKDRVLDYCKNRGFTTRVLPCPDDLKPVRRT